MCSGGGLNGLSIRNRIQNMVKLKYEQKGAPVYQYYFTWQSPMLEDAGAWHTAELAFCFDNTKRCEQGTGNTPEAQALAKKMATAWTNFARTGNPSQPGLTWTPSDPVRCQTMVFDSHCRMEDDPEGELRKMFARLIGERWRAKGSEQLLASQERGQDGTIVGCFGCRRPYSKMIAYSRWASRRARHRPPDSVTGIA